jgi:novobiocin biosynthesis protein NovU/D-mycarose 3-C-methyltransferase
MPDYVIILAWNYAAQIIAKNMAYLDAGGVFVVPLPHLKLIRAGDLLT